MMTKHVKVKHDFPDREKQPPFAAIAPLFSRSGKHFTATGSFYV
jgi:hypothetical protein